MAVQNVFERYELKYMMTFEQRERVFEAMKSYMELDQYGRTTIRNIYFDTDTYLLIRRSIEKPVYKEKLRIRSYSRADSDSEVFVELKKKYKSVVYKRRISMSEHEAMKWLTKGNERDESTQISEEIDYFMDYYKTLHPTIFLSYEREAYYAKDGTDFRVTFDDKILARQENLSLSSEIYGTSVLPEGMVLMEIKCAGAVPLWMTKILSEEHLYKTSFSKYGAAYKQISDNWGGFGGGRFGGGGFGHMSGNSDGSITINGGTLYINASGDGIDANGTLEITGGHTTIVGPTQGDTATLDYDISAVISSGTLIGSGSSMMAQSITGSGQGVIAVSVGQQTENTNIIVSDADGNQILSYAPELSFQIFIFSSPEIISGDSYNLTVGSVSGEIQAN